MSLPSQKIHHILTLLLAFCIPLERRIAPILIALLVLNWLIQWNWKEKVLNCKAHPKTLLPAALYILYGIGMLYSENTPFGLRDLETKMALLALPIVFASQPGIERKNADSLMFSFILGNILAILICFAHSAHIYFDEMYLISSGQLNNVAASPKYFFSSDLSYFMHPSYFAMYLDLCLIHILTVINREADPLPFSKKATYSLLLVLFSLFIVLLASRMGIIVLVLIWLWAIVNVIVKKKYYGLGITGLLLLLGSSVLFYQNSEIIASRVDYTLNTLGTRVLDKTSSESSTVRVLIWEQALDLIKENPLAGVGTGDIKDALMKRYEATGLIGAFDHRLNAHNQFLQTGIALGIPGLFTLVYMLLIPAIRKKNTIFTLFCISTLLNFMVESMLEIQAGVIFYAFFYTIFSQSDTGINHE